MEMQLKLGRGKLPFFFRNFTNGELARVLIELVEV